MGPHSKHVYGAAGSNGLGPKTEHAYRVLGSHGLGQQSEHAHELQDFTGWDINAHMHTELQDLTGKDLRPNMHTELQDRGCRISWVRNTRSNMPSRCQDGAEGTHGLGKLDRGISSGLQDLKGSEHQIEHACEVSGWGCRISRVGNTRSTVPTGFKDGAVGSHRQGTLDCTCLRGTRVGWMILRGRNIRSNMPTRYQVGAAGSHGLGTTDRTCLLCIRSGLQDLMGSKHQIERIYDVFGTTDRTCL